MSDGIRRRTAVFTCGFNALIAAALLGILPAQAAEPSSGVSTEMRVPAGYELIVCDSVDGDVRFDLFMELGRKVTESPKALAMVVLDPTVDEARAEVARFEAADGLLSNSNGVVTGYIDLKNPDTSRKGERVGGTVLGALRSITVDLDIDFSVVPTGSKRYSAQAMFFKRNGEEHVQDLDCVRYR